jgi:hypothetical protein
MAPTYYGTFGFKLVCGKTASNRSPLLRTPKPPAERPDDGGDLLEEAHVEQKCLLLGAVLV